MRLYILKDQVPVEVQGLSEWVTHRSEHAADENVGDTVFGKGRVSTKFLGVDLGHGHSKEPLVFETAVFLDGEDGPEIAGRCSTWEEARRMHSRTVLKARLVDLAGLAKEAIEEHRQGCPECAKNPTPPDIDSPNEIPEGLMEALLESLPEDVLKKGLSGVVVIKRKVPDDSSDDDQTPEVKH